MKVWMLAGLVLFSFCVFAEEHFANGIRIGEVDQDSAIIWTRLTKESFINPDGARFLEAGAHPVPASKQLPPGKTLADMEGAVPEASVSECSGRFHDDDGREAEQQTVPDCASL